MKNTKRILCAVLAMVLLLSVMLTGCKKPQIAFNQIPDTAATYGDGKELTTGQYLAYLYLEFENIYYNQGIYQQEMYAGMYPNMEEPWTQSYPYGEGDDAEKLVLADYILRAAHDNIKRQIVLQQMMKDNGLNWFADEQADIEKNLAGMQPDAFIELGFNNESYGYALKQVNLNERATFYGLYGKDGKRAIPEDELKKYFAENYVSYKTIAIPLTDSNNKELSKEGEAYKKIMELMNGYMETYKKDGFDAAYEQYEKDATKIADIKKAAVTTSSSSSTTTGTGTGSNATASTAATTTTTTTTTTATTTTATSTTGTNTTTTGAEEEEEHEHEHQHRQDVDSTTMDEALKDVIMGKKDKDGKVEIEAIEVGKCEIVEYKQGGSTPTVALIERLDINKDDEGKEGAVYENALENIIYTLKYEDFNKEVKAAMDALKITFNTKVTGHKKCQPQYFRDVINNL